jgi:hypothetical protein
MSFFSFTGGWNSSCLGELVPVEVGRRWGKGVGYRGYSMLHMYVNGKMIPVKTVPEMGGRKDKEEWWRG